MTIKTKVDGKCVQEYLKARIVVFTVILCVGLFYSVVYSVFASIKGTWNEAVSIISVVLGIMIVVMSSTFLIRVKKIIKMVNEHPFEAVYNLEDDVILRTTFS